MAKFIDSHVHLDADDYDTDRDEVIDRARHAGVAAFISIGAGYGAESAQRAVALAESHSDIWATVGIHPHDADTDATIDSLRELASHKRVVGIGETGLDFFRELAPRALQYEWFERQIALAIEVNKPLVIHSREAGSECLRLLRENNAAKVGGVFHCFAEDGAFAASLVELNFYVSFPGIVTFPKADNVRAAVAATPLSQTLIETDGPYLAPVPFRGKRCESSFLVHTAQRIAEIKGVSIEEVARHTTENARRLFNLPSEGMKL